MVRIDGSWLEGGGQILRTSLALSALTLQSFEISDIRKDRPKPGLQPQHLACVRAVEELCNASVEGAELGSSSLRFFPGKVQARTLGVDIGTAGSLSLLLQAVLPPSLFAPGKVRLKLKGGTNVPFSPPIDYFTTVLLPQLSAFAKIECKAMQRGYVPKGGGVVELAILPLFQLQDFDTFTDFRAALSAKLPGIRLAERGRLLKVSGVSHASSDLKQAEVAERQASAARMVLIQQLQRLGMDCPVSIHTEYSDTISTGSGISMFAHFAAKGKDEPSIHNPVILGADALGSQGKRAEIVGQEAAVSLIWEVASGAAVDRHLADQLIPFLAIVGKGSILASEITNHCRTNAYTVEKFVGKCLEFEEGKKIMRSII